MKHRVSTAYSHYGFFLVMILVSACSAQCKTGDKGNIKRTDVETPLPEDQMMSDTLKTSTLNSDKTMELRVNKVFQKGDPAAQLHYAVYLRANDSLIHKGEHRGMNVKWNDNNSIKIVPYVGMEQKPHSENPLDNSQKRGSENEIIIKINKDQNR